MSLAALFQRDSLRPFLVSLVNPRAPRGGSVRLTHHLRTKSISLPIAFTQTSSSMDAPLSVRMPTTSIAPVVYFMDEAKSGSAKSWE
jgi:hypothetical protein